MKIHSRMAWIAGLAFLFVSISTTVGITQEGEQEEGAIPEVWSLYGLIRDGKVGTLGEFIHPPSFPRDGGTLNTPDVRISNDDTVTLSENSIFVSPLDDQLILCSNNSTDWPVTQLYGTQVGWSTDGGQTWTSQDQGPGGQGNNGDPAAVIDRDERFAVGYIDNNAGQGISYSTNSGANWTHVTIATVPDPINDLLDKNHLMVDNVESSPYEGRLYSAWTEFINGGANDNDIVLSFSSDGGDTWSNLMNISDGINAGNHSQGINIQTGPAGEVYTTWVIYDSWPSDENAIGFNSSLNGGATWTGETRILTNIRGVRQTTPDDDTRANSFPSMAVDVSGGSRDGWIYIVWTNIGVPGVNTGDPDIYMIRSDDGGTTWSTAVRVNQDATSNGQWFPWITCNPETGDLFVVFYDRRDDAGDDLTTTYVAMSTDGGDSWEDFQVGDVQFTPAPIPGLAAGYMGDYLGITARGCFVYPMWSDWRDTDPFTAYVSPFVVDNEDPVITCPDDLTVECSADGGTPIDDPQLIPFFDGVSATDNCDDDVEITDDAPPLFPLGDTVVTFLATDDSDNQSSCSATVTVVDTTAPELVVTLNRDVLWPPNHKMSDVVATVEVTDTCDSDADFVLTSITSDEPDNGTGDGDTENDIQGADFGTADVEFQLRSERMGGSDGRTYTIVYTATDGSGNSTETTVEVQVPHDQSGNALAGAGFSNDGSDLLPSVRQFTLVIASHFGIEPEQIDPERSFVGNHLGIVPPDSYRWVDVDHDDVLDLELSYDTHATLVLRQESGLLYPVGMRYEMINGDGFVVNDIFDLEVVVAVDTASTVPDIRLLLPAPNPFTRTTRLSYVISTGGQHVRISVFDVAGRLVRDIVDAEKAAGVHQAIWDGTDENGKPARSGIYFQRVQIGAQERIIRIVKAR